MKLNRSVTLLFALAAVLVPPPVRADDAPVTLTRTHKKGDTSRIKSESDITAGAGEVKLVSTTKTTVKDVKDNGQIVFEEVGEGGKLTLNGTDMDIPATPPITVTREKSGKLVEMKMNADPMSAQSPEITRLLASIGAPIFKDKAVKAGDTWETEVDNPAVKDKKVVVKTKYVGTDKVDGKELWKVEQSAEPVVDAAGAKMPYSATYWLDPSNGQEVKAEVTIKDMPSQYGNLTFKTKATRLKDTEKTDK